LTHITPYHGAVLRITVLVARLLPVVGAMMVLGGCGEPPQPPPTGPPPDFSNPSSVPSGGFPSGGVPAPTYSLPGGYPTYQNPAYPTYPAYPTVTPSSPAPTGPPPAPKCTNGPTAAQVLAAINGKPGIPESAKLVVKSGPYCGGTWQFTTVGESGSDFDPLQVVTNGKPSALKLIEAGADVCSDHVHDAAPTGIRVWACGS
jgi:hypothetical protein